MTLAPAIEAFLIPGFRLPAAPSLISGRRRKIGLLGGSFNPAHAGHLDISLQALKHFGLDEIWWLVSPQNPLKSSQDMAGLSVRRASADKIVKGHKRIRVTDVETELGTRYTADTLRRLRRIYPQARFVWLMGADNLADIRRWRGWTRIFAGLPVGVIDRPAQAHRALAGMAAHRYAAARVKGGLIRRLARLRPPAWAFLAGRLNPLSATQIRQRRTKSSTT